jgi:hypothetical protein
MATLLEDLAPLNGPKLVAVISSGILTQRRDAPPTEFPGPCEIRSEHYQNVGLAAAQSRSHVFVVQPDNLVLDPARTVLTNPTASRFAAADEDRHGLQSLAGTASGEFIAIVGPDDDALLNVARATAGYYIATFEPEAAERNAATHRLEVAVARDRVKVRARPEIIIPRAVAPPAASSATEMLRTPGAFRALPLRAVAYASALEKDKVKVLAALEPVERGVRIVSAVFGLVDTRDKLVVQWTANARELASDPIVTAGEAKPGPYRLRVAAIDANGRQGTVEYELMATLVEAAPVTLSAMVLGTMTDGFTPKLVFGSDQSAVGYFEAYGAVPTADSVTARVEIAAGPEERALAAAAARVITAEPDLRRIVGAVPIAALPPGDYVLRAIVSVDGRPVGRVMRTLRKSTMR